jgi:tripartite-type tricarboxylate transporter receptor subunit TctC
MKTLSVLLRALALAAAGLAVVAAHAAEFPSKPVRWIVPYVAGGNSGDRLARTIAPFMQQELGVPLLVDNKPGASTFIGMQAMLASEPDGHTIAMTSLSTSVLNPMLFNKMPYDPDKDFAPIAYLGGSPYALVTRADLQASSVAQLAALAKASPGKLNYASGSIGNSTHVLAEKFANEAGVKITHVPFNGSSPAIAALLGGQVDFFFASADTVVPLVKAGKLRALAVTSSARMPALPGVPTMAEAGYPNFVMLAWYAVSAPRKTPPAAVDKLSAAINKALADPAFRESHEALGLEVARPGKPQDLLDLYAVEQDKWGKVLRPLNIRLD